jgi:hypothetical protein
VDDAIVRERQLLPADVAAAVGLFVEIVEVVVGEAHR